MNSDYTASNLRTKSKSEYIAWAKRIRQCQHIGASASGAAGSVLLALLSYADADGYCWPLAARLQNDTHLSRNSVFVALGELESLGIIDRRMLTSRSNGRNAPTLYRIGGKVTHLPKNAQRYNLTAKRKSKRRKIAGSKGATYQKAVRRKMGDVPESGTSQKRDVPVSGTGVVPESGTGVVPETGTQKVSIERSDQGTGGGVTVVGGTRQLPFNIEGEKNGDAQRNGHKSKPTGEIDSAPWKFIGTDEPFGHARFQRQWISVYQLRRPGESAERVMERCGQLCQQKKIRVPPPFWELKRKAERMLPSTADHKLSRKWKAASA
jgi:hypothetical protein